MLTTDIKPRLAISFSGGRSSAAMLYLCLENYTATHDILITFINTGCEHEATLQFVDAVDKHFCAPKGQAVVWLEAVINGAGRGPSAKQVTFETAARKGEPFEAAIAKHGVFCQTHPQCTSRLKTEPMQWWRSHHGWPPKTYDTAIGIRYDERIRMARHAERDRFVYPLVEAKWDKEAVNTFLAQFPWDLQLPSDAWGNCTWCWKKSKRKLMTVAKADPAVFDFPGRMERKYGLVSKSHTEEVREPRVFFRGRLSAQDILRDAQTTTFEPYVDVKFATPAHYDEALDIGTSCNESCEVEGTDQ